MANILQQFTKLFKTPDTLQEQTKDPVQSTSTDTLNTKEHLFSLLDYEKKDQINFSDILKLLLEANVKPYNSKAYSIIYNTTNTPNYSERLNFESFSQFLDDLKLTELDLKLLASKDFYHLCGVIDHPIQKVKIPPKFSTNDSDNFNGLQCDKQASLRETLNTIMKKESNKLQPEDAIFKSTELSPEDVESLFIELDIENKDYITFEDFKRGLKTKIGTLYVYNFIIMTKKNYNNGIEIQPEFIKLEDFKTSGSVNEILDLLQVFALLDKNLQITIRPSLLSECKQKIGDSLDASESQALEALIGNTSKLISFHQLAELFSKNKFTLPGIYGLAKKFDAYWRKQDNNTMISIHSPKSMNMDDDKSPMYSTAESYQGSLHGRLSPDHGNLLSNKRQLSALSISDCDIDNKNKMFGNSRFEMRELTPSLPELKPYNDTEIPQDRSSQGSYVPCSLESLNEDDSGSGSRLVANKQNGKKLKDQREFNLAKSDSEEKEKLKLLEENTKLKEFVEIKATEILTMQRSLSQTREELEEEQIKNRLEVEIANAEYEETLKRLETANLEIKRLEIQREESGDKLKQATDQTNKMKKRLTEKVKELLMFKEKMDAVEKKLGEKTRDVEDAIKKKNNNEKNYKDTVENLKGRIGYLTQKFREYLAQNTSLQSQLHEKEGEAKKIQAELEEKNVKAENERQEKDRKICELQQQLENITKGSNSESSENYINYELNDGIEDITSNKDNVTQDLLLKLDEALKSSDSDFDLKEGIKQKIRTLSEEVMNLNRIEEEISKYNIEKAPDEISLEGLTMDQTLTNVTAYIDKLKGWESKCKISDGNFEKGDIKGLLEIFKIKEKESCKIISANIRLFESLEGFLRQRLEFDKNDTNHELQTEIARLRIIMNEKNKETNRLRDIISEYRLKNSGYKKNEDQENREENIPKV